jgi:hypothetical protein
MYYLIAGIPVALLLGVFVLAKILGKEGIAGLDTITAWFLWLLVSSALYGAAYLLWGV